MMIDAKEIVPGMALLFASGVIIGYSKGFKNRKKKTPNTIDYIDGYENGCRDMEKIWQDRLRKMGFNHYNR